MLICILTKNVITSCSVTMMLFLHLEVKPLMTLTTVLDRKSGSAGMPGPISYAVFCLKKKNCGHQMGMGWSNLQRLGPRIATPFPKTAGHDLAPLTHHEVTLAAHSNIDCLPESIGP